MNSWVLLEVGEVVRSKRRIGADVWSWRFAGSRVLSIIWTSRRHTPLDSKAFNFKIPLSSNLVTAIGVDDKLPASEIILSFQSSICRLELLRAVATYQFKEHIASSKTKKH